ncbi:MAG TPA: hypothetical protein VLT79_12335 [Gemmatimonadales bacterium]|nr:hypothetical protein [Gemmatimonadales bacterium]
MSGAADKLRALLAAYAERAESHETGGRGHDAADRKRQACAESLRRVVRPVLEEFTAELKTAGHEASTRDNTTRDDAYPSVALSFTPKPTGPDGARKALASALLFKYDPRRGILVQRDIKPSPSKLRTVTGAGDRLGTIGIEAVSRAWVEQKALTFVEDVLKAN